MGRSTKRWRRPVVLGTPRPPMDFNIAHMMVWYVVFVFSTTFHEASHAFLAYRGGDPTAYLGGHVSLDPMPHIRRSPVGMVLIPLISFPLMHWMVGWASVPFDPEWGRRHPAKQALMSLAGPMANFALAALAFVAIKALIAAGILYPASVLTYSQMVAPPPGAAANSLLAALAMTLSVLLNLNILLGLFNLMPIPPLDGAGVLTGAAPNKVAPLYEKLRDVPMLELLGLIVAWQVFRHIGPPAVYFVAGLV